MITQIQGIEAQTLLQKFESLESQIQALNTKVTPAPQVEYITRKEVAKMCKVSLVTVNAWKNKGILTSYRIGNQVRFKRHEVEAALEQVQSRKGGQRNG